MAQRVPFLRRSAGDLNDRLEEPVEDKLDVMVLIHDPEDFISWPEEKKLHRYERVMEWHDYVENLHSDGKMPWVWGSHQIVNAIWPTTVQNVHVGIYQVRSLAEFDELFEEDPLRDISKYLVVPLSTFFEDVDIDRERTDRMKLDFANGKTEEDLRAFDAYRGRAFKGAPDYVGKVQRRLASNPPVDIQRESEPDEPFRVLVYGTNPDELIGVWDDDKRLIHYEKVDWWADYTSLMLEEGKATHCWGRHDFCASERLGTTSAGAITIFEVEGLGEFGELYKLDPLRECSLFQTVALRPIADQRKADQRRVERSRQRLGLVSEFVTT